MSIKDQAVITCDGEGCEKAIVAASWPNGRDWFAIGEAVGGNGWQQRRGISATARAMKAPVVRHFCPEHQS